MTDAAYNQHSEIRRPSDRGRIVTTGPSRFQPARPEVFQMMSVSGSRKIEWPDFRKSLAAVVAGEHDERMVIDRLLKNQNPLENRNNLASSSPHPGNVIY
jgi:hypothetical protein